MAKDRLWERTGKDKLRAMMGKDKDGLGQKELDANLSRRVLGLDAWMRMAQLQSAASPLYGHPGL